LQIKICEKSFNYVDVQQQFVIIRGMIIKKIREKIKTSGQSLNQIGEMSGVDKAALSRIMHGGGCKVETIDRLFKHFGLEVVAKKSKRAKK
jgi:predicted XRE-type DNA-binding protein